MNFTRVAAVLIALSFSLFAAVPPSSHVVVVMEENHSYSEVIGSSAMPYLNSLARDYAVLTHYYANTHPSIGNYFELTTGRTITNNDSYTGTVSGDNIVRHLLTSGKTWKSYCESLPYTGYLGGNTGSYKKSHNPFAYFTDVRDSSNERDRIVPFTHFAEDLANHSLPSFSFVVPNLLHDAHSGSLASADRWLKTNIGPLLANSEFKTNGILIIVFDESLDSDTAHGGGHVAAIVVGPHVKRGFRSTMFFQHQNTLNTLLDALQTNPDIASAATANDFDVF